MERRHGPLGNRLSCHVCATMVLAGNVRSKKGKRRQGGEGKKKRRSGKKGMRERRGAEVVIRRSVPK